MSAPSEFFEAGTSRAMVDVDAAAACWVVRCREGLNGSAAGEFAHWRASDLRHEAAFQRLSAMSDALQRARRTGATQAIAAELNARAHRRRARRRVLGGAGLAAILILTMGSWLRTQRSQFAVPQASAVASTDSIRHLPDGSLVELNGSAEIAVKFEPGFRRVELLRGEALFSVAKNSSRPFIVRAGGVEVRAVGTAFNVRLENTGVEVLVTEGTVSLENAAGGGSLLSRTPDGKPGTLGAGQKAVVEASHLGAAQVIQVAPNEVTELLSWRRTQVEFSGVELSQAVERINQTNRIQVALESAAIGRLRLTGTFFADDPETFSRLVAETFNLEAETRGDDRILLRQPDRAAPSR